MTIGHGRWLAVAGLLPSLLLAAQPAGRLGYVKDGYAWVTPATGGKTIRLPQSKGVYRLALQPTSGAAAWFTDTGTEDKPVCRGYRAAPPYAAAATMPAPFDKVAVWDMLWSDNGRVAFLDGDGAPARYFPDGTHKPLPGVAQDVSADGKVVVYSTEKELRVWWPETNRTRTLFSIGRPQPLFDALRRSRYPKNLTDILDAIDPELYGNSRNWGQGRPTITPDGKYIFMATNAGLSSGVAGNTMYCFVRLEVATGEIQALSKVGTFYGRVPYVCDISPDGKRLMFIGSFHDSAVVNPCQLYLIDLQTQDENELLWQDEKKSANENLANLTDGACWSPDSRYVAVSVAFYDSTKAWETTEDKLLAKAWNLVLYDAGTGQAVRTIPGAHQPAWAR